MASTSLLLGAPSSIRVSVLRVKIASGVLPTPNAATAGDGRLSIVLPLIRKSRCSSTGL